jgi:methionine biosynthesis protein MetW
MNLEQLGYEAIANLVKEGSSVLDLGCGNGDLLNLLVQKKNVRAQGVEIDEKCIYDCVAKGLSVCHGDIDTGLAEYGDKAFDYVILNQTFQQIKRPDYVLKEALRVGQKVVVGFPNFVFLKARLQLFFWGRVPVTPSLPYEWYNTPNLHFLSIADFSDYCRKNSIRVEHTLFLNGKGTVHFLPNLLAQVGIFLIS